jgi:predicted nucleotidyltransferase
MATKTSRPKKVSEARSPYKTAPRNRILVKCKQTLEQAYGKRFQGVILYGSMARRNSTPSSDMDLLVLLSPPVDYFTELRNLIDVLYPVQLESKWLISAKPVSVRDFESGKTSLYRNVKKRGSPYDAKCRRNFRQYRTCKNFHTGGKGYARKEYFDVAASRDRELFEPFKSPFCRFFAFSGKLPLFQRLCRTMHKKLTSTPPLLLCELSPHSPALFRPFDFSAALRPRFYVPVHFVLRPDLTFPCVRLLCTKSCEPFLFELSCSSLVSRRFFGEWIF